MAFSFIPKTCPILKLKFFQQTSNYHHYSKSVVKYHFQFYTKPYKNSNGPQNHNSKFFGLHIGHYGLYYTIFNREGQNCQPETINILQFNPIRINPLELQWFENFFINDLNSRFKTDIQNLKSRFSTKSFCRNFCHKTNGKSKFIDLIDNTTHNFTPVEPKQQDLPKDLLQQEFSNQEPSLEHESPDTFYENQINLIKSNFNSHQLELIFPIYQSITRNDLSLDSIELYNKVLKSIINRKLNSNQSLEDIEIKLTNLLTVYQDLLKISNPSLKPNAETFNLVINELIDGSLKTLKIRNLNNLPNLVYNESYIKCQEFLLISIELMFSVDIKKLDLNLIYPKLFKILNDYPNLITKDMLNLIFNNLVKNSTELGYYNELIKLSKYFQKFEILSTKRQVYDFILHIYNQFKSNSELINKNNTIHNNYEIYDTMIIELIKSDNIKVATTFLNDILNDYSVNHTYADKLTKFKISSILSNYLTEISNQDLFQAIELTDNFNKINYIPEFSIGYYNHLINQLINKYHQLTNHNNNRNGNEMELYNIYSKIWSLVNYNLIRKDFKIEPSLINFAISLGDHDNIYKLTKIIILNDQLIDPINFKNLLNYYANNQLILTNLIEHQAKYYNDYNKLNDYLSDIVPYINHGTMFYYLINSFMVRDAFNTVNLTKDKIYGIVEISKTMMSYVDANIATISPNDLIKVINLQSILLREFENPELVYVNLDEDLNTFKNNLIEHFTKYSSQLDGSTIAIQDMTKLYNVDVSLNKVSVTPIVDLSLLININNEMGNKKFIELFKKGFKFNDETLLMMINKKFLTESDLNWDKFIKYLSHNENLINQLINQGIDNLTVKIIDKVNITDSIFKNLLLSVSNSDNVYLYQKFQSLDYNLTTENFDAMSKIMIKFNDFENLSQSIAKNPHLKSMVQTNLRNDISTGLIKIIGDEAKLVKFYNHHKQNFVSHQQKILENLLTKLITLKTVPLEKLIKSLQLINLNYLNVENFKKFIKLLTITGSRSSLAILLNKFLHLWTTKTGGLLKFNGLEILIKADDLNQLLTTFKHSFVDLHCEINLLKIELAVNNNRDTNGIDH